MLKDTYENLMKDLHNGVASVQQQKKACWLLAQAAFVMGKLPPEALEILGEKATRAISGLERMQREEAN